MHYFLLQCSERYQNQLRNLLATYELYFGDHQKVRHAALTALMVLLFGYSFDNALSTAILLEVMERYDALFLNSDAGGSSAVGDSCAIRTREVVWIEHGHVFAHSRFVVHLQVCR